MLSRLLSYPLHRTILGGMLLAISSLLAIPTMAADNRTAESILHTLDYVSVDYPGAVKNGKILNDAEYEEQQEFSQRLLPLIDKLPEHNSKPALKQLAAGIVDAINQRRNGDVVSQMCVDLSTKLIASYRIVTAPQKPASLELGKQLFESNCASCHGAEGYGNGPAAMALNPMPANFHDRDRQGQRSPYSLFTTITLGVDGTAMKSYAHLTENQRWALSFYLSTLYNTPIEQQQGQQRPRRAPRTVSTHPDSSPER